MKRGESVSLVRMIQRDSMSTFLSMIGSAWSVLLSVVLVFGSEKVMQSIELVTAFIICVPGGCLASLLFRYFRAKWHLKCFKPVQARVTRTPVTRYSAKYEYHYEFEGVAYRSVISSWSREVLDLSKVTALVDPQKPSHSFIKELFC